mgnify:CR=1 FL=1
MYIVLEVYNFAHHTKKVKKAESFYGFYLTTSLAPSLLHLTLKNAVILAESKYLSTLNSMIDRMTENLIST